MSLKVVQNLTLCEVRIEVVLIVSKPIMVQKFTQALKCSFRYVVRGFGSGKHLTEYKRKKCMAVVGVIKCILLVDFVLQQWMCNYSK
jgi:hypothetical protein